MTAKLVGMGKITSVTPPPPCIPFMHALLEFREKFSIYFFLYFFRNVEQFVYDI